MVDSLRILIVDDNDDLRKLYAVWLGDHEIETADGGQAALELIDDGVDLVLLDRDMPGPGGRDVAIEIHERGYDCHIAMVSSLPADFDIVEYPIDCYLKKPLGESDLVGLVEEYRTQRRYQTALSEYFQLSSKLAAIEEDTPTAQLAESDEYERLKQRVEAKRREVDEAIDVRDVNWNFAFKSTGRSAADGRGVTEGI
jgi:DNA-binding response OmpR family regulator